MTCGRSRYSGSGEGTLAEQNTAATRKTLQVSGVGQLQDKKILWVDTDSSGQTLYSGSLDAGGDEGKIYKSTDYGVTWTLLGQITGDTNMLPKFMIKSETSDTLICVTNEGIVYRSVDDGANWTKELTLTAGTTVAFENSLTEVPSVDTDGVFLIAEYASGVGSGAITYHLWRSTDDGDTWASVLESTPPGTPAGDSDPGHFHSVQYDRHSGNVVVYLDYALPEIHMSDDNGATWSLLYKPASSSLGANYVAALFGETYIGWPTDSGGDGLGKVQRVTRSAFYAGNLDNPETIAQLDTKWGLSSIEIDDGVWLIATARHNPDPSVPAGSYASDVHLVYDNITKVAPAIRYNYPDAYIDDDTAGSQIHFPNQPYDTHGNEKSWLVLPLPRDTTEYDNASVACSITNNGVATEVNSNLIGPQFVDEMTTRQAFQLKATDDETIKGMSYDSTNTRLEIRNDHLDDPGGTRNYTALRLDDSGSIAVVWHNGSGEVTTLNVFNSGLTRIGSVEPRTDDTYYLGENSASTPHAWKGVILKDTTNGNYYRIEITNGAVVATQL